MYTTMAVYSMWLLFCFQVLLQLLSHLNLTLKQSVISRFKQLLSTAWSKSGDNLSQLYAGTRALNVEGKSKVCLIWDQNK